RLLFVADNDTPTVSGPSSHPGLEVFSLPSLHRIADLTTGTPAALPLGVAVDATADRVLVTNEGDGTIVAYSLATLREIARARTGRTPWLLAVDGRRHAVFVPDAMDDTFDVYDDRTLAPAARQVATCEYPTSISVL
ncbi:MAG TPA: hypothetical protein VEJ20_09655, partial [Candidatus Eremiobacteraceae bacterium]|nr:hypothetical protein [Candidatus Eremiobacteraceae bacterium]